ncbi:MAG: YitT family protein [Prevotella sp.]|nr:YitT family protein [Prevotella sp.]
MNLSRELLKSEIKDYTGITLGLLLYTFAFTFFLMPYEIVTGGVAGMAAIIEYATKFPVQYTVVFINIVLLIAGLKILGFKFLMKTIYAIFGMSLFLGMWKEFVPRDAAGDMIKTLGEGQDFLSLVLGCSLTGMGLGFVFVNNGSTGGGDIIAASVNKYYNMSIGSVLIVLDFFIIGSCVLFPQFGEMHHRVQMVVMGLVAMYIENFMLDYTYNKRRSSVQFLIFSDKWQEIADAIGGELHHGVTILDGKGWYSGQERKVLCVMAHKNESTNIFRVIKFIDPKAFVSQSSVIGVYGENFDQIKVGVQVNNKKKEQKE